MQKEFLKVVYQDQDDRVRRRYFSTLTYMCDKLSTEYPGHPMLYNTVVEYGYPFRYNRYLVSKIKIERRNEK